MSAVKTCKTNHARRDPALILDEHASDSLQYSFTEQIQGENTKIVSDIN